MQFMYRPDNFFEAESVGPKITFGEGPLASQLGQLPDLIAPPSPPPGMAYDEHGNLISLHETPPPPSPELSTEFSFDPGEAYGPGWNKTGVPLNDDRKAYLDQWPNEATDEEAEVLNLPPNLWSNPTRKKMGLPPLSTAAEKAQDAYLSQATGRRRRWVWVGVAAGVGVVALLALRAFSGNGRRRR